MKLNQQSLLYIALVLGYCLNLIPINCYSENDTVREYYCNGDLRSEYIVDHNVFVKWIKYSMHSGKKLFEIDFYEILSHETTKSLGFLDSDLTRKDSIFQIIAIDGDAYNVASDRVIDSYSSAYYLYGNQLFEERFTKIFVQDSVNCLFRSFYSDGLINTEIYCNNGVDSMLTCRYKKELLVSKKVFVSGLYLHKITYDKSGNVKNIKEIYQTPEKQAKPREFPHY